MGNDVRLSSPSKCKYKSLKDATIVEAGSAILDIPKRGRDVRAPRACEVPRWHTHGTPGSTTARAATRPTATRDGRMRPPPRGVKHPAPWRSMRGGGRATRRSRTQKSEHSSTAHETSDDRDAPQPAPHAPGIHMMYSLAWVGGRTVRLWRIFRRFSPPHFPEARLGSGSDVRLGLHGAECILREPVRPLRIGAAR
jgi:hypothetical protein